MSTITAVLEADADGTLHLPLPAVLRHSRLKVTATIEAAAELSERPSRAVALRHSNGCGCAAPFRRSPTRWHGSVKSGKAALCRAAMNEPAGQ